MGPWTLVIRRIHSDRSEQGLSLSRKNNRIKNVYLKEMVQYEVAKVPKILSNDPQMMVRVNVAYE